MTYPQKELDVFERRWYQSQAIRVPASEAQRSRRLKIEIMLITTSGDGGHRQNGCQAVNGGARGFMQIYRTAISLLRRKEVPLKLRDKESCIDATISSVAEPRSRILSIAVCKCH